MPNSCFPDSSSLHTFSAETIVAAVADAAERWRDADFPPRVRATQAIERRTGYSTPVVEYALDRLFGGITAYALRAAIVHELGSLAVLDGAVDVPGRPRTRAWGASRVTIVSSDTTIGVAIPPLCFALCARCGVVVKDRSDALVAAFVETLGAERAELAGAVRVGEWTGGSGDAFEREAFGQAEVVVAFGNADALLQIRARCGPDTTFVPFGHRLSAAYLSRGDLARDLTALASAIARDALLYDGQGCLSLRLLFVRRSAAADLERLLDALTRAFAATAVEFPPAARDAAQAARLRAVVGTLEFRAAVGEGRVVRLGESGWVAALDLPRDELPPLVSGVLPLIQVGHRADAANWIREHRMPLQAVGVTDPASDRERSAVMFGAVRTTRIGRMQDPPLAGHHGGRPRIADFVRWIDVEP